MCKTLADAKTRLTGEGLTVSGDDPSLFIAATFESSSPGGVAITKDASLLLRKDEIFVAVFPERLPQTCEFETTLPQLVELIIDVYRVYRAHACTLGHALRETLSSEKYSSCANRPVQKLGG